MKHMRPLNKKARRIGEHVDALQNDVVGLQQNPTQRPHVPMGCALSFSPGWEVDSAGGTAGLCQPVERDIYDCYVTCFWPAQVSPWTTSSSSSGTSDAAPTLDTAYAVGSWSLGFMLPVSLYLAAHGIGLVLKQIRNA